MKLRKYRVRRVDGTVEEFYNCSLSSVHGSRLVIRDADGVAIRVFQENEWTGWDELAPAPGAPGMMVTTTMRRLPTK